MESRTANETNSNDKMLKRIFSNQWTIMEQNLKIQAQERREADEREHGKTTTPKVPSFVKVSQFNVFLL